MSNSILLSAAIIVNFFRKLFYCGVVGILTPEGILAHSKAETCGHLALFSMYVAYEMGIAHRMMQYSAAASTYAPGELMLKYSTAIGKCTHAAHACSVIYTA